MPSATARGPGRAGRRLRPHRGQPGDPVQRGGEADRVDQVARAQAEVRRGRDEPGQGGAGGQHDLEADPVQRQPGGKLARRQQGGHERAAGRAVHRAERGLHRDQGVQRPEQAQPGERLGGERRRHQGQAGAGDQHELAPVGASTTGPHSSPTMRVGTICATPIAPTAKEEWVRS